MNKKTNIIKILTLAIMKKTISILFALIVFNCLFLTSCSQDTNLTTKDTDLENNIYDSNLISEITNINKQLLDSKRTTRGKKPGKSGWTTKETLNVVLADCSGAWHGAKGGLNIGSKIGVFFGQPHTGAVIGGIIGGVVCGGAASWLAAPEKPRKISLRKSLTPFPKDSVSLRYPQVASKFEGFTNANSELVDTLVVTNVEIKKKIELDNETLSKINLNEQQLSYGKMHNVLLSLLDGSTTLKENNICHSNDTIYNSIINSKDINTLYNEIMENTKKGIFFNSDSKSEYIMELFSEIFENYVKDGDDLVSIVNKYSEAINASTELDEDDKNCILSGLATAIYSYNYWNTSLSKEQ